MNESHAHGDEPNLPTIIADPPSPNPNASIGATKIINKICIPSIFLNILHLAIENNSMDVLRICLKYGLNPNESGTCARKFFLNTENNKRPNANQDSLFLNSSKKTVRYQLKCAYCLKRLHRQQQNEHAQHSHQSTAAETNNIQAINKKINALLCELEMKSKQKPPQPDAVNDATLQKEDLEQINYSSYGYLIRLVPLFLSVSRCNHAATELLLTYDACPNLQDELGNTPLHLAVAKRQPCHECVFLLLKYHATSLVFNNRLQTPLTIIRLVTTDQPPTNGDENTPNNNKQLWNYSLSSVYFKIIKELFKNLDILAQSEKQQQQQSQQKILGSKLNQLAAINELNMREKSPTPVVRVDNRRNPNFKKSFTLVQHPKKHMPLSHSLKNLSRLKNHSSSNSLSTLVLESVHLAGTPTDQARGKQEFFRRMFRNNSSSTDTNNDTTTTTTSNRQAAKVSSKIKSSKPNLFIETAALNRSQKNLLSTAPSTAAKSRSLTNVQPQQQSSASPSPSPAPTPAHMAQLDKHEKMLLKKYARYSKASPKSVSAIVRIPTLTQTNKHDSSKRFSKQTSFSQSMINKLNLVSANASTPPPNGLNSFNILTNLSRSTSKTNTNLVSNLDFSNQNSLDGAVASNLGVSAIPFSSNSNSNQNKDNVSVVSSKISLFKKTVSINYHTIYVKNCTYFDCLFFSITH